MNKQDAENNVRESNRRMTRQIVLVFLIFLPIPYFMPMLDFLFNEQVLNFLTVIVPSPKKLADAAISPGVVQAYFSLVLIFGFFFGVWQFLCVMDARSYFVRAVGMKMKSPGAGIVLWLKFFLGTMWIMLLLWYVYFLPGGVNLQHQHTRGLLMLSIATNFKGAMGVFGGFLAVGMAVGWIGIFLGVYFVLHAPFVKWMK